MPIPDQALTLLELPEVRRRVAAHTGFSRGRELVLELTPATAAGSVASRLGRTAEARELLQLEPGFTIGGAHDVRRAAEMAALGYRLEPRALLNLTDQLRALRRSRQALAKRRAEFPDLWSILEPLDPLTALESRIGRTLDDEGRVLDTASDELAALRAKLQRERRRVQSLMQQLVRAPGKRRMLQEPIVTERAGRLVVPVKQAYRAEFGGIVHDASASGATLFMEPHAAVEPNNRVRELELAEVREIDRVLLELSSQVGEARDAIAAGVEGMAALDLALALARYAEGLKAVRPKISTDGGFSLHQARHPLLEGAVVPIDIELRPSGPDGYRAIVITGPNTGGKTVALKTVGLLHCMAACGMHLPAGDGSSVAVYETILADIGDEQSIEQSLSTFSSHMGNLVKMVTAAGPRTLVLADELGAGTDPHEGAALAQAIVEKLLEAGAAVVVTTHHPDLKTFAFSHPLARNASVEFDIETLRPTYRLLMGVPGKSNALAIAERLGLDPEVVARARDRLTAEHQDVEAIIQTLHSERDAAERARATADAEAQRMVTLRDELEGRLAATDEESQRVLLRARREARELLRQARNALRDAGRAARPEQRGDRERARDRLRRAEHRLEPRAPAPPKSPASPVQVAIGDRIEIDGFGADAEVVGLDSRTVEVVAGSIRTRVPREKVRAVLPPAKRRGRRRKSTPRHGPPLEINLRGVRAAEIEALVEAALDQALLSGADSLRIVHGKGGGVLRRAVREQLDDHPAVASLAEAPLNEGGDGVTVVRLAAD